MWWIIAVLALLAFDVNYFVRFITTMLSVHIFLPKKKLTETVTSYGICTTQDIDVFLDHMNNVRFLRELDFARYDWFGRTRFWSILRSRGGATVQGATTIRYRRMIGLFRPFRVETRLVWWDERSLFLEHRFVTLTDGFVRAVAISRQVATGGFSLGELIGQFDECREKPERPAEIGHWLDAIEVSSRTLRKEQ
uniref:Protein THEM6 n=1 Tax=Culex tarsalis TaxID=7177 RepID=A0A1Q3FNZ1_CULTA